MDKVMELLLNSWIGILSLFTVVFVIGMGIFLYVFLSKQMKEGGQK